MTEANQNDRRRYAIANIRPDCIVYPVVEHTPGEAVRTFDVDANGDGVYGVTSLNQIKNPDLAVFAWPWQAWNESETV